MARAAVAVAPARQRDFLDLHVLTLSGSERRPIGTATLYGRAQYLINLLDNAEQWLPSERCKAVGVRGQDGKWHGFDWINYAADANDLQRWQRMGAGIGIRTSDLLAAVDADTLNKSHATTIQDLTYKRLGILPTRVGRWPKVLYLVRLSAPMKYTRIEFGERNEKNQLTSRVEILAEGRQFVAHGLHPVTKAPYVWPIPLVALDQLPVVAPTDLPALLEDLRAILPAATPIITEGSDAEINQASLRGDLEKVRAAVAATPNTSAAFGTREA